MASSTLVPWRRVPPACFHHAITPTRAADGLEQFKILLHGQLAERAHHGVACALELFLELLDLLEIFLLL